MNKQKIYYSLAAILAFLCLPNAGFSQTLPQNVQQLHTVLENVYNDMLPLCEKLITIGRALAGFGATFYIGYRVWKHIANAEPIDLFPLLRPFVLAILVGIFPATMGVINGILKPTVTATAAIVQNSNDAVANLLKDRENAIKNTDEWKALVGPTGSGDRDKWYKYTHPNSTSGEGILESIPNDMKFFMSKIMYNLQYYFKYLLSSVLELLYYAASLCIDTIRTFYLIVLTVLGPLVFGFSCFDGYLQSLTHWLGRYINIYLWLPVANLFGAILGQIQQNMLKLDLTQLQQGGTTSFTSTDAAYLIFLVIGIFGYFTVPSVANYIIHTHGGNQIVEKARRGVSSAGSMISSLTSGGNSSTVQNSNFGSTTTSSTRGNSNFSNKISG